LKPAGVALRVFELKGLISPLTPFPTALFFSMLEFAAYSFPTVKLRGLLKTLF